MSDFVCVPRRDPSVQIPLAFAQEPMWLAELFEPGNPIYNSFEPLRLRGAVDAAALQNAFDEIVRRHEILRTSFRLVDGEPSQIVMPTGTFPLESIDRHDLVAGAPELDTLCSAFVRRPFDLAKGPLARALLVRLTPDDSVLILVLHHIVRDGWAMGVLLKEIGDLLDRSAHEPALAPLPIQFGDYALWQRRAAADGAFERQRAYWKDRLVGAPLVLDLPTDRRGVATTAGGRQRAIEIPRVTVTALRALAKSEHATFFMTLMAAFQAFIHRYTGASDLLVGFPVASRRIPETQPLLGCFINTVVLRTTLEASDTFRELLARVRTDALEAYANQDFPFLQLVEELRPDRRFGQSPIIQSPIIQTMITLIDPRRPKLRLPDASVEPYPLATEAAKLDLALEMLEHADGLTVRIEYRRDLFDDTTAQALLDHFGVLLGAIVENPETRVDALELVSSAQREQLFELLRGAERPRAERCIDDLIREQSIRNPNSTAVVCGTERISYHELDVAAERLARRLRRCGATRETLVAILCEPSVAMIVAVLAVLKSGAAYLPIDARYPADRLRTVIEDAQVVVALADAQNCGRLAPYVQTLVFGDAGEDEGDLHAPVTARGSGDLAYLMYTSGTTGKPKGVAVEHRSVVAYVDAIIDYYGLGRDDTVLQFTSLSFDTSVQDIFATLTAGATLAIATPEMRNSPVELMRGCERLGVTLFDLPTAYWHILVDDIGSARVRIPLTLRLAIVGGEAMAPAAARTWLERTGVRLVNGYGPTETTVQATVHDVTAADVGGATIPVGRPLPNVHVYVLDAALAPVPRGAVGQLYIGGTGVARGYHRRPDLTARRFVRDVGLSGAARMYATGDLARIDGAGMIHVLGRNDGQVKIRGFRIETGEIESALLRCASVRACAVVACADASGEKRLVAHVVATAGAAIDVSALDAQLRARLPEYMIPAISPIAALPLTLTGKVDRAALPTPQVNAPRAAALVEPRDDLERSLVTLWEELLHHKPIGVRDNFFALGGHSLLAARMASQVERRLGIGLPLAALFAAQTIEEIATLLRHGAAGDQRVVLQLQAGDTRLPLFFLHGDYEGGGMYCRHLAEGLGSDQSLFVVRPHGYADGPDVPAVEAMAAERVRAIREVQPHGPYLLGGYCIGGSVALEMARQFAADGEFVPLVALIDAPLGLRKIPGLRLVVDVLSALLRWPRARRIRTYVRWHRRVSHFTTLGPKEWVGRLVRAGKHGFSEQVDPAGQLAQSYSETLQRYTPTRYAGRVLMINSRADGSARHGSPIDWTGVASAASMHVLTSDHEALVREHGTAVGERIRREIDLIGIGS